MCIFNKSRFFIACNETYDTHMDNNLAMRYLPLSNAVKHSSVASFYLRAEQRKSQICRRQKNSHFSLYRHISADITISAAGWRASRVLVPGALCRRLLVKGSLHGVGREGNTCRGGLSMRSLHNTRLALPNASPHCEVTATVRMHTVLSVQCRPTVKQRYRYSIASTW